jgi:hypothetical protein
MSTIKFSAVKCLDDNDDSNKENHDPRRHRRHVGFLLLSPTAHTPQTMVNITTAITTFDAGILISIGTPSLYLDSIDCGELAAVTKAVLTICSGDQKPSTVSATTTLEMNTTVPCTDTIVLYTSSLAKMKLLLPSRLVGRVHLVPLDAVSAFSSLHMAKTIQNQFCDDRVSYHLLDWSNGGSDTMSSSALATLWSTRNRRTKSTFWFLDIDEKKQEKDEEEHPVVASIKIEHRVLSKIVRMWLNDAATTTKSDSHLVASRNKILNMLPLLVRRIIRNNLQGQCEVTVEVLASCLDCIIDDLALGIQMQLTHGVDALDRGRLRRSMVVFRPPPDLAMRAMRKHRRDIGLRHVYGSVIRKTRTRRTTPYVRRGRPAHLYDAAGRSIAVSGRWKNKKVE